MYTKFYLPTVFQSSDIDPSFYISTAQNHSSVMTLKLIFERGCYISALEHNRMLIVSSYILLAYINIIYKYGHAWYDLVRSIIQF